MQDSIFWMVAGKGPSSFRHETREAAEREAERLASQNPGTPFHVMAAVSVFRTANVERRDLANDAANNLWRSMERIVAATSENSVAGSIARDALRAQAQVDSAEPRA